MKTYHIIYKEKYNSTTTCGVNIKAINPIIAIGEMRLIYPTYIFMGMYDLEAVAGLSGNTQVIQEQAEVDDVIRMNKENMIDDERDMTSLQF